MQDVDIGVLVEDQIVVLLVRAIAEGNLILVCLGVNGVSDMDLPQIGKALGAIGLLARLAKRRQKNADEHSDDPDHNQQFDEGERTSLGPDHCSSATGMRVANLSGY